MILNFTVEISPGKSLSNKTINEIGDCYESIMSIDFFQQERIKIKMFANKLYITLFEK